MQRRGVRVTVVSTIACQPPMIADELRRRADVFTDLMEQRAKVGRDPSDRPHRASAARRVRPNCGSAPQDRVRRPTNSIGDYPSPFGTRIHNRLNIANDTRRALNPARRI
jgi:hypothetical protein